MTEPLHVLVIEDNEADFLLIQRQLMHHGLPVRCRRVASLEQLTRAIEDGCWAVVLADYTVPQMSFSECLALVLTHLPDVPIVVVSGTIGEEQAVALMKQGVSDFVLKDGLLRLGPAVERSLREAADHRAMRAVQAQLRLLNAAMNAAANAIVITDRHGTIVWINPAFAALTGYTPDEALGKNPRDLVTSGTHSREFFKDLWDTILAGRVWTGEVINRRKDGSYFPEGQTITPVKDAAGAITHFVAIKRDLTAERQQQEALLDAQKTETLGRLASGIAHDFNNLITAINATADLAILERPEGDPVRADFARIIEIGERAASLTRQLLAFSRRQVAGREALDLAGVVTDMRDMLARLLTENITMVVLPARGDGYVLADRSQIEQVVVNLVVNARDAMPTGGVLTVETQDVELDAQSAARLSPALPGPYVMLAVSDTGVGMDAVTQARMFEPYFTNKLAGRGTGLGLATVHGIVTQSGGSIGVHSELGKGSTFRVYLPRVDDCQPVPQPVPAPAASGTGTETILLVEDEAYLRDIARRMLEAAGYVVLTADSGEEALRVLDAYDGPVNLVLTDVVMPGLSGHGLSEQLAARGSTMRILYSSGYTEDVILHHGLLDTTVHFLSKPYTMADLLGKVRETLDAPPAGTGDPVC